LAGESDTSGIEAIFSVQGANDLRSGAMVTVQLERPTVANALVVPYAALQGADLLYRIDENNRLERQRVERLGEVQQKNGERWLLVRAEELAAGDRVMSTNLPNAAQGLRVEVTNTPVGEGITP
jgi:hypothetical protein